MRQRPLELEFLHSVADRAVSFLESLDARPVGATASVDLLRSRLDRPLPGHSLPAAEAIDELVAGVEGGLVARAGPRYFGFVIGGATERRRKGEPATSSKCRSHANLNQRMDR